MSIERAKKYLESNETELAKKLLLEIIESDKKNISAILLLCGISTRTQDWNLGSDIFRTLSQIRPKDSLASSGLVQSLFNLSKFDEAIDEMNRFREATDNSTEENKIVLKEYEKIHKEIEKTRRQE